MAPKDFSEESCNREAGRAWNLRDHLLGQHGVPTTVDADGGEHTLDALGAYHLGLHNPWAAHQPHHSHTREELVADSPVLQELLEGLRAVELGRDA